MSRFLAYAILSFAFRLCLILDANAQVTLKGYSFSTGAGTPLSGSYSLKASVGLPLTGNAASASFNTQAGADISVVDKGPDLVFTSITVVPSTVSKGKESTVFFTIRNAGASEAGKEVVVRGYLSIDPAFHESDLALTSVLPVVSNLAANTDFIETAGIKVTIPTGVSLGPWFLFLVADPLASVNESNENNNTIFQSITVVDNSDKLPPVISNITSGEFKNGSSVSASITDNEDLKKVSFHYRPITASAFLSNALTVSGTVYSTLIKEEWGDGIGMEGYFTAEDESGNKADSLSSRRFWYRPSDPNTTIPFVSSFGGKTNTYEMFSIPYNLEKNGITSIFEELSEGEYDKTQWRVFHYEEKENKESATMSIIPGLGYWINMKEKKPIKIGEGAVVPNNQSDPFELTLAPGWNQIGNPYPFDISWTTVAGNNENVSELNLWSNGKYSDELNLFEAWRGAFVFNDLGSTIRLHIPVTAKATSARTKGIEFTSNLDAETWKLNLLLETGELSQVSGIGMHPLAKLSKDRYDKIALPRFMDYVEMNVHHPEFFAPSFTTDVVPGIAEHTWLFDIKSSLTGERAELKWDHMAIEHSESSLVLIDLLDQTWVDMKTVGTYSFTQKEGRKIKIIYNREGELHPGITLLGDAYPNPFAAELTIPVLAGQAGLHQIQIFDALGRRVRVIDKEFTKPGVLEFKWEGTDENGNDVSSGLLFYRLAGTSGGAVKRIIKR